MNLRLLRRKRTAALLLAALSPSAASAQTSYSWNGATINWLDPSNWVPSTGFPGSIGTAATGNTDIADVQTLETLTSIGIGFASGNTVLSLGALDFSNLFAGNRTIGSTSTTANGTLVLNGATVNGIVNTLISVDESSNLTIQGVVGSGTRTMSLRLGTTNGVIQVAEGRALTISTAISQSTAGSRITLTGGGLLTLTAANSFNGGVTITGSSTVQITNPNQLGTPIGNTSANYILLDNGNLNLNLAFNVAGLMGSNRTIALGAGGGTLYVGQGGVGIGNIPLSMAISDAAPGAGRLTMAGTQAYFTGNNTFSGGITILSAGFAFHDDFNLGAAPAAYQANNILAFNTSSLLYFGASGSIHGNRGIQIGTPDGTGAGNLTFAVSDANTVLSYNGVISDYGSGSGRLNISGNGTLISRGNNTFTGCLTLIGTSTLVLSGTNLTTDVTLANGTLTLDYTQANSPQQNILPSTGLLRMGNVAGCTSLIMQGAAGANNTQTLSGTLTLNTGLNRISVSSGSGGSASLVLGQSVIRNAAALLTFTLPTNGNIIFNGNSLFTGTNGILISTSRTAFATANPSQWAARTAGNAVVPGNTISGFYTASTSTTLANNADVSPGVDTNLPGNATITSLRFAVPSENRAISLVGNNTLSVGGILVAPEVSAGNVSINGGTLRGNGSSDLVIFQNNPSGSLAIGAKIIGSQQLVKAGNGTLILSGTNSNYTGNTVIYEGTVQAGANNSFSPNSLVTLVKSTTLRLNGFDQTTGHITAVASDGQTRFAVIENGSNNPATLTISSGAGGGTYLGSLRDGGNASLALTKVGSGILILSDSFFNLSERSYSGNTTVLGGTMTMALSFTGTGPVVVGNNTVVSGNPAVFDFQGNLSGPIFARGYGTVAVGLSSAPVTLNALQGATFEPNSSLRIQIGAIGSTDKFNVVGNTSDLNLISGGNTPILRLVDFTGFNRAASGNYTITTITDGNRFKLNGVTIPDNTILGTKVIGGASTGAITIDTSNFFTTLQSGDTFILWRSGNNLILSYNTPVPEPTGMLTLLVGGLGAFRAIRRRNRTTWDRNTLA